MNVDGSDLTNLTNNPGCDEFPAWSSNGQQLAFVSNRESAYGIYFMNVDGSNFVLLINVQEGWLTPDWKPSS